MESPFTDYSGPGDHQQHEFQDELLLESPFSDVPVQQYMSNANAEPEHLLLQEVHKAGDATLTVADPGKAASDEYREPTPSGNPLLVLSKADRLLRISENFTVGEYAQAQSGKYKFDFARIDPDLVRNLQKLRTFIGKPVTIVDGYYTPAYLKDVLGIKDNARISLNPHVKGRGVKFYVKGYDGMIKQLAIAALVACDNRINLGIGETTLTLYVKQELSKVVDLEEDYQRIVSYISDERIKVAAYTFTVDVKRLLNDYKDVYQQEMKRAVSAFAVIILKIHYKQDNIPAEWMDWETPLGNVVSLMHSKSITKDPNVFLYCLAYSAFGNLYRNFLKSKTVNDVVDYLVNNLTSNSDRQNKYTKGSFLANQNEIDKTRFIDNCRQRIIVGKRSDGTLYNVSTPILFDWMYHPQDKIFKEKLSEFIVKVFSENEKFYDVPHQQSPVGGTRTNLTETPPDHDKPVIDFTGRYYAPFDPGHDTLYGRYILINQAGNYISGKIGGIFKKSVKSLRNTITEFYGKMDDKGVAICHIYPQQTLMLKKFPNEIRVAQVDNPTRKYLLNAPVLLRSKIPVISNMIMNSFARISDRNHDLMITLAWIQPTPDQLKVFFDSFKTSEQEVKSAITEYYEVDETRPSLKQSGLKKFMSRLDLAINNYSKLPPMFKTFSNYYTRFVYGNSAHWSPRSDRETRSLLDWIRKMLEDYRDFKGQGKLEANYKWLYENFGVTEIIPDIQYQYDLKINLTSYGLGPFARSSGPIIITNKTDFSKYPAAERWAVANHSVVVWNATLSLNPLTLAPKIGAGQTIQSSVITDAPYSAQDFSGAEIQITEGKVFELPLSNSSGKVKASTKAGIGSVVILIDGIGKKTLEFSSDLDLSLPDSIEIEPDVSNAKEGTYEKIARMLPSLTMYKGRIEPKKTDADISSIPLPDNFSGNYQLKDTRYFMHDNAELTAQAKEAIGRLCAEELIAFSDTNSKLEIYGHADASGKPDDNIKLSRYRALNVLQAIKDRLGDKLKAKIDKVEGMGEAEANNYGEHTQKNAWFRRVVVLINGRAVLSLGEI